MINSDHLQLFKAAIENIFELIKKMLILIYDVLNVLYGLNKCLSNVGTFSIHLFL